MKCLHSNCEEVIVWILAFSLLQHIVQAHVLLISSLPANNKTRWQWQHLQLISAICRKCLVYSEYKSYKHSHPSWQDCYFKTCRQPSGWNLFCSCLPEHWLKAEISFTPWTGSTVKIQTCCNILFKILNKFYDLIRFPFLYQHCSFCLQLNLIVF